jgi:hypothetical protein
LDYFPRERFLFLEFEEFFSNPEKGLQDVFEFVGVSEQQVTIDRKFNTGDYESDFDSELIADLKDDFKPYNERLYDLVGREFGWGY